MTALDHIETPPTTTHGAAIEATGLVKTYPGDVRALDGVDFTVQTGTIFALLGPNGAGKSTTVKILTTLSRPDSGAARVAGLDVLRRPERVRRAIGVVAQRSGVDRDATGRENLELQGALNGLGGRELRQRVDELLVRFSLDQAADRVARTYSGGMQRRLDVAMGLIHRPEVLFLDEPTTGLDPEIRAAMWDEISRLTHEEGLTILLTTHYLEEADGLAHRLAIIDGGHLVAEGTSEQLKSELEGDTIHVELREAADEELVKAVLARAGVRDATIEAARIHARAGDGAEALPGVLAALEADGLAVASVSLSRPSLDDVYLRYTGHAFERAHEEGT